MSMKMSSTYQQPRVPAHGELRVPAHGEVMPPHPGQSSCRWMGLWWGDLIVVNFNLSSCLFNKKVFLKSVFYFCTFMYLKKQKYLEKRKRETAPPAGPSQPEPF